MVICQGELVRKLDWFLDICGTFYRDQLLSKDRRAGGGAEQQGRPLDLEVVCRGVCTGYKEMTALEIALENGHVEAAAFLQELLANQKAGHPFGRKKRPKSAMKKKSSGLSSKEFLMRTVCFTNRLLAIRKTAPGA